MKKLFKEVWKSFSKSKIILIGLIVLIFLSSGIITLIFDVVNSYRNQYRLFNTKSVKQDLTMDSKINLFGSDPEDYYLNLVTNQWHYYEKNNYINSIKVINTKDENTSNGEYFRLNDINQSYSQKDIYVRTQDLSELLNTNLNIGLLKETNDGSQVFVFPPDLKGRNFLQTYQKETNNKFTSRNQIYDQISILNDVYDDQTQQWSNSRNTLNFWENNSFVPIVIDLESNQAFLKSALLKNTTSQEYIKYNKSKNDKNIFIEIDTAPLLGFKNKKLDTTSTWILDGDIKNQQNGITAANFFKQSNLPQLKQTFNLIDPIDNINSLTIKKSWFVYNKNKITLTKRDYQLNGIQKIDNNNYVIDKNIWKGFYYEWLDHISKDENEFKKLVNWTYWTKDVETALVDYQDNPIQTNQQFKSDLLISDLTKEIQKNGDNNKTSIVDIEKPYGQESVNALYERINKDLNVVNKNQIKTKATSFKYKQVYERIKEIVDKTGIRETLTVSDNGNAYQFINLGNNKNEINWNGENIKQEVGKLISTNLNNPIFSLKSNVDATAKEVPINYVSKIIERLLSGLSINREYLDPTVSFISFTYKNQNNEEITLSNQKNIWLSENKNQESKLYGVTAIGKNQSKTYFILEGLVNDDKITWTPYKYLQGCTYEELEKFIISNNLNFASIDWNRKPKNVVGEKGWIKQDLLYSDKYFVPFQYLLPSSNILSDYNSALNNNFANGKYGLEKMKESLIESLSLSLQPLISTSNWITLLDGVNKSFAKYGFVSSFNPPAQITVSTITKTAIGVFWEAINSTNQDFANTFFANLIDGINRNITNDNTLPIKEQQENLEKEINNLLKIIELSTGSPVSVDFIINFVNDLTNGQYTKISEIISNPYEFLNGLKIIISSINLDKTFNEFWDHFYVKNNDLNRTIGLGDFLPYLYRNIYSTDQFNNGLHKLVSSTVLKDVKVIDVLKKYKDFLPEYVQNLMPIISALLGKDTIADAIKWIKMKNPEEGYLLLKNAAKEKINPLFQTKSLILNTYDILSLFKLNTGKFLVPEIELNSFITKDDPNNDIEIPYDPNQILNLELDMNLLWYLEGFVLKDENGDPSKIFGLDLAHFINSGVKSITEIKEDENQIVLNENAGKIAIVNQSFLDENKKSVYTSSTLDQDLNDLSKIDNQYKINVGGVEYAIISKDFSVDYLYPVINNENINVDTKTQALVYVNQFGFDRAKRSNPNAPYENYFLLKAKNGENIKDVQTKLNKLLYQIQTGSEYQGTDINSENNSYKKAYLYNEYSLLNPERSLRMSMIETLIYNLEFVQKFVGLLLFVIISIVIIFVIKRYIGTRAKVIGILVAQGYSVWEIALSICLFPLFVSIIGATLGYIVGLISQLSIFKLLSIFWKIPFLMIPFNWITFMLTLIIPILLLSLLTICTTLWFLRKHRPLSMMNGSMEIVQSNSVTTKIRSWTKNTSVKNKFSVSLAMGSIGKLLALLISTTFASSLTLFYAVTFNGFNNSINKTYKNKNYHYQMKYLSPSIESTNIKTFNIDSKNIDINNMLYVPVGDPGEGHTYLSDYFKPGYSSIFNKNNLNGNIDPSDTTTPHIFTKSSLDLLVDVKPSFDIWNTLYNALPESQKASIISISQKASQWMEWTQEGRPYQLNNNSYVTRFVNFNTDNEYLSLWDNNNQRYYQILNPETNQYEDIKINYFDYLLDNNKPQDSEFVYRQSINNKYINSKIVITGNASDNAIRSQYRLFLVNAYDWMLNHDISDITKIPSLLDVELRSLMPEYQMDYFISPGAIFINSKDEKFTYLKGINLENENIKPEINGYNENSKNISVVDNKGNNLLKIANQFKQDGVYPLIVNNVVASKYKLKEGTTLNFEITNDYNRFENKLKNNLGIVINKKIVKFQIIGISQSYINEEWITSQKVANSILDLNEDAFNGILSNTDSPISLVNSLPLLAVNGYWSGDNKIVSYPLTNDLSESDKDKIVNIYSELFYKPGDNKINNSLFAKNLRRIYPSYDDNQIDQTIKSFLGLNDLNLKEQKDYLKARESINKFVQIYTDDSLSAFLLNINSQGIEKGYIENASKTVDSGMIIMLAISFVISLTILIIITSMILGENEKNIAIFSILGYTNKEKLRMFFSIYLPIVVVAILISFLINWLFLPWFLSTVLASTSILLPVQLSFTHIIIVLFIILGIFTSICGVSWCAQGRIKPIILLKKV